MQIQDRSGSLYERASDRPRRSDAIAKKLDKALKRARRKSCIALFLREANALGLYRAQLDFWNECDEAFVRQWCAERDIEIIE